VLERYPGSRDRDQREQYPSILIVRSYFDFKLAERGPGKGGTGVALIFRARERPRRLSPYVTRSATPGRPDFAAAGIPRTPFFGCKTTTGQFPLIFSVAPALSIKLLRSLTAIRRS